MSANHYVNLLQAHLAQLKGDYTVSGDLLRNAKPDLAKGCFLYHCNVDMCLAEP